MEQRLAERDPAIFRRRRQNARSTRKSASSVETATGFPRVDGATYVIDAGMGSIRNYRTSCNWGDLRAVFLTHHHSDHVYGLGSFLVTGWQVAGESFSRPIQVYGLGKPPRIPALNAEHARRIDERTAGREMAGTAEMVDALLDRVFSSDIAIRMADKGRDNRHEWVSGHDIEIPESAQADPVQARHPRMEPFEVYSDELVTVSANLVDHRLCYPAFGFRIDSRYGRPELHSAWRWRRPTIPSEQSSLRMRRERLPCPTWCSMKSVSHFV